MPLVFNKNKKRKSIMKINTVKILSLLVLVLVIFGMSHTSLANIYCEEECYGDKSCEIEVEVCSIVTDSFIEVGKSTIEQETLGKLVKTMVGGAIIASLERYTSAEYYNKIIDIVRDSVQGSGSGSFKETFLNMKIENKKRFGIDLLWLAGDVLVELTNNKIMALDDSSMQYKYRKSITWWIQIGYIDFKALANPNKFDAVYEVVDGSWDVLTDMAKSINETMQEIEGLEWDTRYSEASTEINMKKHEYFKFYSKATNPSEKAELLDSFKGFVVGSDNQKGFLLERGDIYPTDYLKGTDYFDAYNSKIRSLAMEGEQQIIKFDDAKAFLVEKLINDNDFDAFVEYVTKYYTQSDVIYLSKLFHAHNFDSGVRTSKTRASAIYLTRAIDYGFPIEDFLLSNGFFQGGAHINECEADKIVMKACRLSYKCTLNTSSHTCSTSDYITRRKFAISLNTIFKLDEGLHSEVVTHLKSRGAILEESVGWFYDALVLKVRKIATGHGIKTENQFRPDDNLTMFECLKMLVNTIDHDTCGKVPCKLIDKLSEVGKM